MSAPVPELDEDILNAGGPEAVEHLFTWNVEFLQWLQEFQLPDERTPGAFPLPMSAYLQLTRALYYGQRLSLQNAMKKASAPSQSAPASTA